MRKWLAVLVTLGLAVGLFATGVQASPVHDFTVVFKAGTLPANAEAMVKAAGGTVVKAIPDVGVMNVSGPAALLKSLGGNREILAISPTIIVKAAPEQAVEAAVEPRVDTSAADLYNAYQWDIKQMTNNGASWGLGTGSHNTVVGIIDTGVSTQHPALKANLLGGRNFTPDGPGGTVVPTDIEDKNGHGSHTAGNIAGNGRILGIGPDLGFKSYRVFGATGGSPDVTILEAMVAAINDGVDVISMSLGGFEGMSGYTWTDPSDGTVYKFKDVAFFVAYQRVLKYATSRGIVVVAAAGNDATNISNPAAVTALLNATYGADGYRFWGASREVPGTIPGVVTVSATGPDMSLASYSNYGPGAIDVAAPGGDFQRYGVDADWFTDMCLSSYKNGGYVWMAGTSMATPKVAAVVALIIDQAKAAGVRLTPAQAVAKLQQSAVDLGKPGADPFFGKGMANAFNALAQ